MKMYKLSILILLTMVLMFPSMGLTVLAVDKPLQEKKRTVRVAYPEQKYLTETDQNGNYYGYSYEYLKKVAEFANWELKYVTYPGLSLNEQLVKSMESIESGDADLLGVMLKNDELKKKYLYPDKNYGAVYTTLDSLDSNFHINETNYMHQGVLKVAVLKQAKTRNAELTSFLENSKIKYEYIYCDDTTEQLQALKDEKADVLLKVSLTFLPDLKQIVQFSPRPYYFVSSYGNEDLVAELDEAITKINITDPYFEDRLQNKYFQNTIADFDLDDIEKEYVSQNKDLKVLLLPQYAPFTFVDKENKLCGMSVSILNEIGKNTGINFNYHILKDSENLSTVVASGKYDIVLGPPHSDSFAESNGLVLSQPYLETSLTMFSNKQSEDKSKDESVLALLKDVSDPIEYEYKEIKYYNDIEECLNAVNNGEADYGYASSYIIDFYTSQNSHRNLKYLNLSGYNRAIGFYVPNTKDSELLSIINKYVRSMPIKDVHSYLTIALSQKDYGGIQELIENNPMLVITVSVAFLVLIFLILMLFIYSRTNKKRNEKLQQAFAAKSDFLSRMSHDMRTPMNGIIGLTGLTLDIDLLPEEAIDNLEKIDESAKYLLSLINDTLDMNKIESNKVILNKEATDLHTFFEKMMSVAKVSADQGKICLIARPSTEDIPAVYLDKVRVQQIVFNIISNAIKFTPENGTVEVIGECTLIEDSKVHAVLKIKDSGIGISSEFLPNIFEPFEQEYNSSTSDYTGTGLGLAIVKNLVDIMDGKIFVTSEKNHGTEFSIELDFDVADLNKNELVSEGISDDVLIGKRVLLCEDHPLNAQIATKLLEKKGMLVEYAENGKIAIDLFEKSDCGYYDIILMDIRMPILDGLSATKVIRKLQRSDSQDIPIIAMTANAFDEDVRKSMEAGMSKHLAKPIEPDKLYEVLKSFIISK